MIGRTNSGSGGGLSPNNAVIHITAQVGSSITLSKGEVVAKVLPPEKSHINAKDSTMADWYYTINSSNYGSWVVTATLGEDTQSDTINIDSNEQYDIILNYGYYIFRSGHGALVSFNKFARGVNIYNDYIEVTNAVNGASYLQTSGSINLTNYKAFKVDAITTWVGTDSSWTGRAVVRTNLPGTQPEKPTNSTVASTNFTVSARQTYSVNISSLASSYYLGYAGNYYGKIYNMWLEKV